MKRSTFGFVAAGVLVAGSVTIGVGTSNADTVQTEGSYPTHQACQDAGPGKKVTVPPFNWTDFVCSPDPKIHGNWLLVLRMP